MKKYAELSEETKERIYSHINFGKKDKCWDWESQINQAGRPKITIEKTEGGKRTVKTVMVQHFMLDDSGVDVDVRFVDPVCGNPICCNPSHLRPRDFDTRFWGNIKKNENGCWIWQGNFSKDTGYGSITIDHKSHSTHRVSYETHYNEKVPEGLMVLHKCNTKLCINPDHLYVGTHNDNMKDMANSNVMKGERNPNTLLTESQVVEIKQKIKSRKVFYRNIAAEYGVSRQAIKDIALGRTWKWLEAE